jgi:subtilisin family serine protease
MSGTSMATPIVSGVCALALSAMRDDPTPEEMKRMIVESADDAGDPGHDNNFGWGLIRPDKIVAQPASPEDSDGFDLGIAKVIMLKKGQVSPHAGILIYA